MTNKKPFGDKTWKRLDNMANIFPAIEIFQHAPIYRVEISLDRLIDKNILRAAINDVLQRFPYYKVKLGKGIFWAYLEHNKKDVVLQHDTICPCVGINYRKNNHYLFKIKYYSGTIALEIFHALTDGGGAMILLNTLAARYLNLADKNIDIKPDEKYGIWDIDAPVTESEYDDSFYRYFDRKQKALGIKSPAYHFKGTKNKQDIIMYIKATMQSSQILQLSKSYGLTVTEFLTSVYMQSLLNLQAKTKDRRPVRLSVPVNLRRILPSKTMRNFTFFVLGEIFPVKDKQYSFEEIAETVKSQLSKGTGREEIIKAFSGNVNSELNYFVRLLPLKLKLVLLSIIYSRRGENQYSGSLSNLGNVKLPEEMAKHVEGYCCYLSPNSINPTNCGVVSYNNRMNITFVRTVKESDVEKEFFEFLIKKGIKIKVESNY